MERMMESQRLSRPYGYPDTVSDHRIDQRLIGGGMAAMADRPENDAMWPWALAALVNAGGYLGFIWHAHSGHPVLLLISNLLIGAWLALVGEGFKRFYAHAWPRGLLWLPLPIMLVGVLLLLENFQGRVVVVALILSCQVLLLLFMVWHHRQETPGRGYLIIIISLLALLILLSIRALMAFLGALENMSSIFQSNALQVLTFQAGLLAMILLALGVIVLTLERTEQILAASERRFRILFEASRQPLTLMDRDGSLRPSIQRRSDYFICNNRNS